MWTNSKWEEDLYDLEKNWIVVNSKFSNNVILLPGNISQSNPCAIQNRKCFLMLADVTPLHVLTPAGLDLTG